MKKSLLKSISLRWPAAALLLAITGLAYAPGLHGPFLLDDEVNIQANSALHLQRFDLQQLLNAAFSLHSGPLMRPISYLSFALNYLYSGLDPYSYKLTNLALHLLNGISLGLLTHTLLRVCARRHESVLSAARQYWLSLAVAGAWLLHPFNLTSVLYVVQRMNSLAALFTVWGMIFYLWGREGLGIVPVTAEMPKTHSPTKERRGWLFMAAGFFGFGALAVFSKETGLLLGLFLLLSEWLLCGFRTARPVNQPRLWALHGVLTIAPVLAAAAYFLVFDLDGLRGSYLNRNFDLSTRILTEPRGLWFYVRMILFPDVRGMGLFHDDFPFSGGLLQPPETLFALLEWLLVVAAAILLRRKAPLFSYGILFFLLGHALESSVFPLEMLFEHRNYLPAFGLLLAQAYYLLHPAPAYFSAIRLQWRMALGAIFMLACAGGLVQRAADWSGEWRLARTEMQNHPQSGRSLSYAGNQLVKLAKYEARQDRRERAAEILQNLRKLLAENRKIDAYYLDADFSLLRLDAYEGKPLNAELFGELERHLADRPLSAQAVTNLFNFAADIGNHRADKRGNALRLIDAVLRNARLDGKHRVDFLTLAASLEKARGNSAAAQSYLERLAALQAARG